MLKHALNNPLCPLVKHGTKLVTKLKSVVGDQGSRIRTAALQRPCYQRGRAVLSQGL